MKRKWKAASFDTVVLVHRQSHGSSSGIPSVPSPGIVIIFHVFHTQNPTSTVHITVLSKTSLEHKVLNVLDISRFTITVRVLSIRFQGEDRVIECDINEVEEMGSSIFLLRTICVVLKLNS
jgi:hypothetical protein